MINQIVTINNPPSSAQGSGGGSEVNAVSARSRNPTQTNGKAEAQAPEAFGAVLARQMDDSKNAATETAPANGITPEKVSLENLAQETMVADTRETKANKTASLKDQDKTAPPDQPPATLTALFFGNQEIKLPVINQASGDTGTASRSISGFKTANYLTALRQTTHQQATASLTVQPREQPDPKITSRNKPEVAFAGQPELHAAAESPKTAELPAAALSVTAPSAQVLAQQGNALVASSLQPGTLTTPSNNAANNLNTISAPLGSSAWPEEFSQKISWVSTQQNQVAELHLNPPDLGPMSVVLTMNDNQASAQFSSPHLAVREAIENALPKLRESLADNGIMLGNATVSDQSPRDSGANNFMSQRPQPANERTDFASTLPASATTPLPGVSRHIGMVDTFA